MRQPVIHDATLVRIRGEARAPIWWQGLQWAVTEFGIEARDGTYVIPAERLGETRGTGRNGAAVAEWLQHMADKNWVDVEDFATAFLVALPLHGVTAFTREALDESLRLMRKVRDRAPAW